MAVDYGRSSRAVPVMQAKKSFWKTVVQQKWLILMVLPGTLLVFVFAYLPIFGIAISFEDFNVFQGVMHSPWVGFQNFGYFLSSPAALQLLKNTFLLGVVSLVFGFPAPIIFALFLNELTSMRFRKVVQSVSYLPHFISTVIIIGIMGEMADQHGLFNQIGHLFGAPTIQFFASPGWFRPLFVGSNIWQSLGWSAILYMAALTGIDQELYQVAELDGANRWQKAIHVTLPGIAPTIMILLIMSVGSILGSDWQKALLMQSPTNLQTSNIVGTYVYQTGIQNAIFGEATAVGLMMSIISLAFLVGVNWLSKKSTEHSLW